MGLWITSASEPVPGFLAGRSLERPQFAMRRARRQHRKQAPAEPACPISPETPETARARPSSDES